MPHSFDGSTPQEMIALKPRGAFDSVGEDGGVPASHPEADPAEWCASIMTTELERSGAGEWSADGYDSERVERSHREFLAILAHELRNPLAAINYAVQVWLVSNRQEDVDWVKDVIHRQSQHLTRVIDELLDISHISAPRDDGR
jgi:signal transduction histidine kinase